jgi:uncharacterized membrane protein
MKPSANALSMNAGDPPAFDNPFHSGPRERLIRTLVVSTGLAIALALIVLLGGRARLHWPDFSLLAGQPLVIQLHVAAASTALLIGVGLMWGPKGTTIHRAFGWTWVIAMMTVALSSFFIHTINPGGFSPIHALSAYVAIGVPMGVAFARRHDIRAHRRMMTGNFLFGLIVAGAFTFVPGRLMWRVFFG